MSLANVSPRVRRSLVTNDMQNSSDIENLTVLNSTGDVVKLNQTDENVPNFNNTAEFISTSISTSLQPKKPLIADGNNLPNDGPESYSEIKKKANEKPNEAKVAFSNSTTISSTLAIMTSNTSILLTSWTTVPTISSTTTSVTTSTFTTTTVPTTSATISNNSEVNKGDSTVRYLSWRDYWIHFLHEVKSNRFQMSYVIISVVPMVVVLLMCCAVACRFGADMRNWQTPPPSHGGVDGGASSIEPLGSGANDLFQPRSARKQPGRPEKYQRYTVSAAVLFFFLLMGMESAVYNLLTYYVAVGKGTAQSSGVEMTAVFWISIAISRLLAIFVRSSMSSRAILTLCHVAMIFTSSIV